MDSVTVAELRRLGFKVRIGHFRKVRNLGYRSRLISPSELKWQAPITDDGWNEYWDLNPLGGETRVWITDTVSKYEFETVVKCDNKDHYNKKIGVSIAMKRFSEDFRAYVVRTHLG